MLTHEFVALPSESIVGSISYSVINQINSIAIPDEVVLANITVFFTGFFAYWDSFDYPNEGLNYHGITIIPTGELPRFVCALSQLKAECGINDLILLCKSAEFHKECIVHLGI